MPSRRASKAKRSLKSKSPIKEFNPTTSSLSLTTLPVEVLLHIIQYVLYDSSRDRSTLREKRFSNAEVVPRSGKRQAYLTFLHDKTPVLNGLQALGAVNHQFHQLCCPWLWRKLHFPTQYSIPVDFWTKQVLPKHGDWVRSLTMSLSSECATLPKRSTRQRTARLVYDNTAISTCSHVRRPPILPIELLHTERAKLSVESALSLISLCPNLLTLDLELPAVELQGPKAAQRKAHLQNVLLSLLSHVTGLRHLKIGQTWPLRLPDGGMSKLLSQLPLLESLSFIHLTASDPITGPESFGFQLSCLKNLTTLKLFRIDSLHPSWCEYDWPKSITELCLEQCNTFSPKYMPSLIHAIAPRVIRLKLGYGYRALVLPEASDAGASWSELRFDLPALTDLSLDTHATSDLTICFEDCKNVRQIKYHNPRRMDWIAISELVPKATWPQLECIDFSGGFNIPYCDYDAEPLGLYCQDKEILLICKRGLRHLVNNWDSSDDGYTTEEEEEDVMDYTDSEDDSLMGNDFPFWEMNLFHNATMEAFYHEDDSYDELDHPFGFDDPDHPWGFEDPLGLLF